MNKLPTPQKNIDTDILHKFCDKFMNYLHSGMYQKNHFYEDYAFEAILEAVYGEDIFDYINDLTDNYKEYERSLITSGNTLPYESIKGVGFHSH